MLTKGIVEEVLSDYQAKVRLPIFNKAKNAVGATPKSELNTAIVCTLPNTVLGLQVGDVVIVGFEDNSTSKPIILGYLSTDRPSKAKSSINLNGLSVESQATLPASTTIGLVSAENIQALEGIKANIQWQLDLIDAVINGGNGSTLLALNPIYTDIVTNLTVDEANNLIVTYNNNIGKPLRLFTPAASVENINDIQQLVPAFNQLLQNLRAVGLLEAGNKQ